MPDPSSSLATFLALTSEKERQAFFTARSDLRTPEAVQALCTQANTLVREDLKQANESARAALWLANALQHTFSQGLAHRTLANTFSLLARPSEALTEYEAAIHIFQELGDREQAAITRSSAIPTVTDALGTDSAFAWADEARETFRASGDQLRLARLENNLGTILHRQENYDQALEHWLTAYDQLKAIGEAADQAAVLRNLAVCCISMNKPLEAKQYYEKARDLCRQHNFTFLLHTVEYNIAYLYYLQGDHQTALRLYREARQRSKRIGDTFHEALCSLDESDIYIELSLFPEAATVAELAERQFTELQRPYEAAKAMFNRALVSFGLGDIHIALNRLAAADRVFGREGNRLWPGQVALFRALILLSEGRQFEARRAAVSARESFARFGLAYRRALADLVLARVYFEQRQYSESEGLSQEALQTLETLREPEALFQGYLLLGELLEQQGHPERALAILRRAETQVSELSERRPSYFPKLSIFAERWTVYSNLVAMLLRETAGSSVSAEVFSLLEKVRLQTLASLSAPPGRQFRPVSSMRSQLVDQVSQLRAELNWLYRRLDRSEFHDTQPRASALSALQIQSQEKELELARTLADLRGPSRPNGEPESSSRVPDVEAVQAALTDRVLVEYLVAEDIVTAVVVSENGFLAQPVAITSQVMELQRRLWYYLRRHSPPQLSGEAARAERPLNRILEELYSELLLPLAKILGQRPLVISPHRFLYLIPFHALITQDDYLIERVPVSYIPSAASLLTSLGYPCTPTEEVALIDSIGSAQSATIFPAGFGEVHRHRVDSQSTAEAVRDLLQRPRAALHLVTQGHLRDDNALFSRLQIGPGGVSLHDLCRLRMQCRQLSLEGAGFGTSFTGAGRGVSALWTALILSGVQAALLPAWPCSTESHRLQATLLYEGLSRGLGAADAHRHVMLTLLQQAMPLQEWAGLALVGSPVASAAAA